MKVCDTFEATIYVGLKEGYDGIVHDIKEVEEICQEYTDSIGLCLTVTATKFIYTGGNENGAIIGLINYPRFPDNQSNIVDKAETLARRLMKQLKQERVSIVFNDGKHYTVMLENKEYVNE